MFDYRLKVFYTVAQRLSFTKAAFDLYISQPAVTRHIRELETQLKTKLFSRSGAGVQLTESGKILLSYAEKSNALSRDLEFSLAAVENRTAGKLRLAASTTIAQYILPEIMARFKERYPSIFIELLSGNSQDVEQLLRNGSIDAGLVEGEAKSALIDYTFFRPDEIVLTCRTENPLAATISAVEDIANLTFVVRENGSGTQEFIQSELKKAGFNPADLSVAIRLGSTEGTKNYLLHSDSFAFLPVSSLIHELRNGQLQIVDLVNFSIKRNFQVVTLKGEQSELITLFQKFLGHN